MVALFSHTRGSFGKYYSAEALLAFFYLYLSDKLMEHYHSDAGPLTEDLVILELLHLNHT